MTSHVMDLTRSGQFQIITDLAPRGWLSHQSPDYLTFQIILPTFGSTFWINLLNQLTQSSLLIKSAAPLAYDTSLPQTYVRRRVYSYLLSYVWFRSLTFLRITHSSRREAYHPRAPLGGSVDESPARRS